MKLCSVSIPGRGVTLEGVWHMPSADDPLPAVIVCHPHPLYGGSMHNNVVLTICEGLAAAGIAALRFNFRGIGGSTGGYSDGSGEIQDVAAAIAFAAGYDGIDASRLGLAGYSFGGGMAIPAAADGKQVKALALISPAAEAEHWQRLADYTGPRMVLAGALDDLAPLATIQHYVDEDELSVINSADHFWFGHEDALSDAVSGFFRDVL